MIPKTEAGTFFAVDRGKLSPLILKNGQTVDVCVLKKFPDGSARIGIRGFVFTATAPKDIKQGAVAKMLVRLTDNKLFLTPLQQDNPQINPKSDFFSQRGIPKNAMLQSLLSFFQELGLKIEIPALERIAQSAKRIARNEKKTAFLAAMLDEKGIFPDDIAFQKLYEVVFPEDSYDNKNQDKNSKQNSQKKDKNQDVCEEELLKTVNHIHGGNFHWIVVPFEKQFSSATATGSCSLLLNLKDKNCKKVTLRATINKTKWTFVIENGVCKFIAEENKNITEISELTDVLLKEFQKRYLDFEVSYGIVENTVKPIDISV
ncbi:MAG: hypothetical protein CR988_03095 [Treponema sp.]|nr:MAG: hypothetical protein CR988_03095 [Treponema sp.]